MKAFVTGATGFIGSHVADILSEKGMDVRCAVRKTSNLRWVDGKGYDLVETDFNDPDSVKKAVAGCDYVFHVGGQTYGRDLDDFLRGNRDVTLRMLEAAAENPNLKRFLHVSSQTVAGPAESLDKPIDETMPCKPITAYGKSKLAGEAEVAKFADKFPSTIVRLPAIFGPRDTAIFDFFKTVNKGLGALIGMNKKYLSLLHSSDAARGCVEAALSDNTVGETYFVSSEKFYSWDFLVDEIKNALGGKFVLKLRTPEFVVLGAARISEFFGKFSSKPPVFNYEKGLDFIQDYWICSTEKAMRDFGYRQKTPIEEGLRDAIDWYKKNGWL